MKLPGDFEARMWDAMERAMAHAKDPEFKPPVVLDDDGVTFDIQRHVDDLRIATFIGGVQGRVARGDDPLDAITAELLESFSEPGKLTAHNRRLVARLVELGVPEAVAGPWLTRRAPRRKDRL